MYVGLNKVLVKQLELPKSSELIVSSNNLLSYGEILSVGAINKDFNVNESMFKEGDRVYYLSQAGLKVDVEDLENTKLLNITDILISK